MEKYYRIAGVEIAAEIPDQWMYTDERNLAPFQVPCVAAPHHFSFAIADTLEPPKGTRMATLPDFAVYNQMDTQVRYEGAVNGNWETAFLRAEHRDKMHHVTCKRENYPGRLTAKTVLNAMQAEHLIARAGGFVLHASYVGWRDRAILFTAPSGTGKSTQADLWACLRGGEIINGDRVAVRCVDGAFYAYGIPFAGSSRICKNCTLPIAALVVLAQAPQTSIRPMNGAEAFCRIWEGISLNLWDKEDVAQVSATVQRLLERVPVYYLACTPDESAVAALEGQLGE